MDYSSYRLKNLAENKSKGKQHTPTPKRSDKKQRKIRGDFWIVCIVLLSFAITAILANLIGGGNLISALSFFDSGNKYYLVATATSEPRYTALAESSYIIKSGGAGNLYKMEDDYIVIISAFMDTKSANTVSQNNKDTQVVCIKCECPTTEDLNDYVCDMYAEINVFLQDLIGICIGLDTKDIAENVAISALQDIRNTLLCHIAYLSEVECSEHTLNITNGILQPIYGGLDAILYDTNYVSLSGAIRSVVVTEICALESINDI